MCDACEWEDYAEEIEELLDDEDAQWAEDTLNGIQKWVIDNRHITTMQISAFENIKSAVERRK